MDGPHTHACRLCTADVHCELPGCRRMGVHCDDCERGIAEVDALRLPVRTLDAAVQLLEDATRRAYRRARTGHATARRLLVQELDRLAPADPLADDALSWARRGAIDGALAAFDGHGQPPKYEHLPPPLIQHCYNATFAAAYMIGLAVRNEETKA